MSAALHNSHGDEQCSWEDFVEVIIREVDSVLVTTKHLAHGSSQFSYIADFPGGSD